MNKINTKNLFRHMVGTFYRTNLEGYLIFVSPSAEKQIGFTVKELVGRQLADLYIDKNIRQQFLQQLKENDRQIVSFQAALRHKDGGEVWMMTSASYYYDKEGGIAGVEGIVRNISVKHQAQKELKRCQDELEKLMDKHTAELQKNEAIVKYKSVEKALRETEAQYRSFVQNFRGIAFRGRMDFSPIFFHGAVEEITGYTEKEFLNEKLRWDQIIHPKDLSALFTGNEEKLHSIPNYLYEREYRIVCKGGTIRWVHEVIQNICDDSGKIDTLQGTISDITKRKQTEEEQQKLQATILQARNEWRQIFDSVSELIALLDRDHRITRINQALARKLALEPEQCVGHYCYEIMHGMSQAPGSCLHMQTMADGQTHNLNQYNKRLGGWFTFSTTPVRDIEGKITGTVMVAKDISESKAYEIKLQKINENLETQVAEQVSNIQQREQLLRSIFHASPICIGVVKNRIVTYVNPKMEQVTGYSIDELCGQSARLVYPSDEEFEYVGREKYRQIQENGTGSVETKWQRKDGNTIDILLSSSPIDVQHPGAGNTFTALDITSNKQLELKLQESNKKLKALINASPDIICFKDGEGRWLLANKAYLQMYRLSGVDYNGKTDAELAPYSDFYHDALITCMETDKETWKKGELSRIEKIIPIHDGDDRVFDIVKIPLFQADGTRQGLVVQGHDITERIRINKNLHQEIVARRQATEVLQKKGRELEEANIALRVLLKQQNNVTEEVQQRVLTQLEKAVLPYIDLLRQSSLDDKGKEYLDIITSHVRKIGAPFIKQLSNPNLNLTKREILVADLVRQGKSTKEIAKLLNLKLSSVETYRNKIRKNYVLTIKKLRYFNT